MFVDDSLFAQIREYIKHSMAASIEALYSVLGFPETAKRHDPLSLDKYFESVCSYIRTQLGIVINTRDMSIGLSEKKRLSILDELSHWHNRRRSFTLLQGVVLCGSLEFWANTSPWVRFLYHQLRLSINNCLRNCVEITKHKTEIKNLITDLANSQDLDTHELKSKFIQKKIAKDTYKCQSKAYINKSLKKELGMMKSILSNPSSYKLTTPIAHIIKREADFISFGDACLQAGGGYVDNLFWWHTEWPSEIRALTIKNLTVIRKCQKTHEIVSINLLEFVVEIINYAAITVLFQKDSSLCSHQYPLLLNWTDNMTSKSWIKKAVTKTQKGKCLQHILCSLMINNPVGLRAEHIEGKSNILADSISRIYIIRLILKTLLHHYFRSFLK